MNRIAIAILSCVTCLCMACGSGNDVGGQCHTTGSTDECNNGICAPDSVNRLVCQKKCSTFTECPLGATCSPVPGSSSRSCKPN